MRRAALLILACCAFPAALQAQACLGQARWTPRPIKIGGLLGLGHSTVILGTAALGKDEGFFGGVGLGVETNGGTATIIQGEFGFELKESLADKLSLCPIATLFYETDSEDGLSVTVFDILAGLGLGYPIALNSDKMALSLTGSLQLGNAHFSLEGCELCSGNDFVGLLDLGAGLVVSGRWSLVPQLRLPISSGADPSFLLRVTLTVGKPRA